MGAAAAVNWMGNRLVALWVPNPAITGVGRFSAGMTPFTPGVTGSMTGVVKPLLTRDALRASAVEPLCGPTLGAPNRLLE